MSISGTNQIARRIHDGIAQDLVALGYSIDQSLGAPELPISTRAELRTLRFEVSGLIEKVRREIFNLRNLAPDLTEVAVSICGSRLGRLDIQTEIAPSLQPIIIELLRNAALHSGASVINLEARRNENFILIEVSDNGIGEIQMKRNRFGLIGITEAISELSGHIEFLDTKPGLAIRVSIPA